MTNYCPYRRVAKGWASCECGDNTDNLLTIFSPLLDATRNPPSNRQWHRSRPKIESLLPLQLPIGTRELKVIPSNERRHENGLLHVADVAPNTAPPARAEGDERHLGPLRAVAKPPLGPELLGLIKNIRVPVRSVGRDSDRGAARYPVTAYIHAFLRSLAVNPERDGGREPERLIEARAEVGEVSDGCVGGDDNVVCDSLVYFLAKT